MLHLSYSQFSTLLFFYFRSVAQLFNKIQAYLYAFRLRTLPLAFSSIITGSFIAYHDDFSNRTFGLALLTTLLLQVLSNLANDYGDSQKGTDNADRIGPVRAIQGGMLSVVEIKWAIGICTVLCLGTGCSLIYVSLHEQAIEALLFLVLGIGAITAAIKYTVGKGAYGYYGMGDIFVLLFFGIVGVGGSHYLQVHRLDLTVWAMGLSIGCFATGVLNLNNMRDREGDQKAGKNTIVVKIGALNAVRYHTLLLLLGWAVALCYTYTHLSTSVDYIYVLTAPLFWRNIAAVWRIKDPRDYDPLLKQLAIATFLFSIFFGIGQVVG